MTAHHLLIAGRSSARLVGTLNPSDKGANIALSNGDLTASNAAAVWNSVRSTIAAGAGAKKYYAEFLIGAFPSGGVFVGIGSLSALVGNYCGADAQGVGYNNNGTVYNNGGSLGTLATYAAGDNVALTLDNVGSGGLGSLRFYKNNVAQGSAINVSNALNWFLMPSAYLGALSLLQTPVNPVPSGYVYWGN